MSVTKVTDDNIVNIAASKLTGAMPAIDGSNLTGIVSGPTISSSDPAITTNATLGTQWANSTSGEFFILTDATTDSNVWTNVGAGTGDVQPYSYPGLTSGYAQGGGSTRSDVKDKWSFSSDGNAADAGNITVARSTFSGYSSQTNGYSAGGRTTGSPNSGSFASSNEEVIPSTPPSSSVGIQTVPSSSSSIGVPRSASTSACS